MRTYLINTQTLRVVGRFASVEDADAAGQAAAFEYTTASDAGELGSLFAGRELLKLFNNHGNGSRPVDRFASKDVGAKRTWDRFESLDFEAAPEKVEKSKAKAEEPKQRRNGRGTPFERRTFERAPREESGYPKACRRRTHRSDVVDLLARPSGATFEDIAAVVAPRYSRATAWAMLGEDVTRVKGYGVRCTLDKDGTPRFFLTYAGDRTTPVPHFGKQS